MRIAVLASNSGEKALYLYDFFREGNRITFDCLLTDDTESPVARAFKEDGIEVVVMNSETDLDSMVEKFKADDVKLLVADGFEGEVPSILKDYFGKGLIELHNAVEAPLDVIKAADALYADEHPETIKKIQPETKDSKGTEDEWADALGENTPKAEENVPPVPPVKQAWFRPAAQQPPQTPQQRWGRQSEAPQQQFAQASAEQQEPMPDTYLVWSVIITIIFSMIPGIIAIIYSSKVSSRYYAGNIEGAKRASRTAQIWCIVSIILGILWMTFYLPLVLLSA